MDRWENCKKVLCVRLDNLGDVLMSAPAMTALRESLGCTISLLTSSRGRDIARYLPAVDEIITCDTSWVKGPKPAALEEFISIVELLRKKNFDAAVIFTVFSQSPLPAALMLMLANIPVRLAYCRENPYHLLTHWVPDDEPYRQIRHQVQRDLDLVSHAGATIGSPRIVIRLPQNYEETVREKLQQAGVDSTRPWIIFHPGVSEPKREYPSKDWIEAGRRIIKEFDYQIVLTGSADERTQAMQIAENIGPQAFCLAGVLSLEAFMTLIRFAPLLVSVNSAPIHIAAAFQTKVIVLYALTNPQHTPWKATGKVLPYSIPREIQSRNEVLRHLQRHYFSDQYPRVTPDSIVSAVRELMVENREPLIDYVIPGNYGTRKSLNFQAP